MGLVAGHACRIGRRRGDSGLPARESLGRRRFEVRESADMWTHLVSDKREREEGGLRDWLAGPRGSRACCGWAFAGGRKGAGQRLEDRGRREQAGWLVGLQSKREREGKKFLFFYFKTYFKTILKAI